MISMNEELLINLVQEYRELYDPEYKYYEDQPRREVAWQELSSKLKQSAHECKERWKRLRDNYRRARKLRQRKKTRGTKKVKAIKYENILCFMDPIIDNFNRRETKEKTEDSGSERQEPEVCNVPPIPVSMEPLVMENYVESKHPLTTFFINVGETVKTFPEEVQVRVKRDIFKIINEAEEEVYRKKIKISQVRDAHMKYEVNY